MPIHGCIRINSMAIRILTEQRIWDEAKEELEKTIPASSYAWINSCEPAGITNAMFTVVTGLSMAVDIIRKNHLKQIKDALAHVLGSEIDFEIIFDKKAAEKIKHDRELLEAKYQKYKDKIEADIHPERKQAQQQKSMEKSIENMSQMRSGTNLNLKYKFENFVVGENNKMAYSVAQIVAKHPAEKYNPLFIYGGSGLGKTHLMQAIGHYILFNIPKKKVKYIKTQDFVNQYINGLREKDKTASMINFRQKFKHVDVLLIDDIQFIESKKKCMEELFYIFDNLQQLNKQIVITSDRLPKDIPTLPDRLRTRFEMGIVVDIKPPSMDTRMKILNTWANELRLSIDDDVNKYIALHFYGNVRELEGAFNKVTAFADIEGADINLNFTQKVLKTETEMKKITIDKIAETVAEAYDLTVDNLKSTSRVQSISDARKYTIYLAREMTKMSYEDIAKYLNKKHSTILYSYEKVVEALDRNAEVKERIRELKQAIRCKL